LKICPFSDKECIHPSWADCQYEFAGDEPEYVELWKRMEEYKMGRNCCYLPQGISRTDMLTALGAFGEKEKQSVLDRINRGRK
jgi:hypothetical protein